MSDSLSALRDVSHRAGDLPALHAILPADAGLSLTDKQTLVGQAKVLIAEVYAHLHLKKALYGIDPVQRLTLLQYRLEDSDDEVVTHELEFHRELLSIFHSLHDLHTNYVLPVPYRRLTAILPFLVEEFFDDKQRASYIVTKMITGYSHPHFKPGAEILLWNGLPIAEAIRLNGENESGSNAAARFAVGLRSLTIRPLSLSLPPAEAHILIHYRDADGKERSTEFNWLTLESGGRNVAETGLSPAMSVSYHRGMPASLQLTTDPDEIYHQSLLGYHLQAEQINACLKHLYANDAESPPLPPSLTQPLDNSLPKVIRAATVSTPSGDFGYLRIFSFMLDDPHQFLMEIIRLLQALPQQGLVLDIRGNPGGLITAAEGMLQLFTPNPIEPERAQFKTSPLIREICRRNSPSLLIPQVNLQPWVDSLSRAHASGALYSTGHPLTLPAEANHIGQVYTGPVVLLTDAYCYSAADMFAAGFRDHAIGPILGANNNTGAGGANVWQHMLLRLLANAPGSGESDPLPRVFKELPRFADFRVSSRRMLRVGEQAGMPLEDFGVEPDHRHFMTRTDILNGNEDLFNHAGRLLAGLPHYELHVSVDARQCQLQVRTRNIDRIDWFIDGRARGSMDINSTQTTITLPTSPQKRRLSLQAYWQNRMVAVSKQYIVCED